MNKGVILLFGGAVLYGLYSWGSRYASKIAYTFKGVGKVQFQKDGILVPLSMTITNNNDKPFVINSMTGQVFYQDSQSAVKVSNLERKDAVTVPKGNLDYQFFMKLPYLTLGTSIMTVIQEKTFWRKFRASGALNVTVGGINSDVKFNEILQLSA